MCFLARRSTAAVFKKQLFCTHFFDDILKRSTRLLLLAVDLSAIPFSQGKVFFITIIKSQQLSSRLVLRSYRKVESGPHSGMWIEVGSHVVMQWGPYATFQHKYKIGGKFKYAHELSTCKLLSLSLIFTLPGRP